MSRKTDELNIFDLLKKVYLCTLKNGLAVYKGDMVMNFESPADRVVELYPGDYHLVFENRDHFVFASEQLTDEELTHYLDDDEDNNVTA